MNYSKFFNAGIALKSFSSVVVIIFFLMIISPQKVSAGDSKLDSLVNRAIKVSLIHLENSVKEVNDTELFPTYGTKQLRWILKPSDEWTSGFYPGCLWYAYELSKDPKFKKWALQWTSSIEKEKNNTETHDLGFRFMCSFGNGLRLGDSRYNDKYKNILLTAANTLSQRYSPVVGCFSSNWDLHKTENSFPVIVDIMMNLDLLFWASENGGSKDFVEYARSHALKTCRDFIRADGSTYHIVRYDKYSGKIINKGTLQGAGDETTWSRGHAWATYGMVVMYRYTKEKQFLDTAIRLANYFVNNLPHDHVSAWDFQSNINYRDVSATCIVASALFEMIKYIEDDSLKNHFQSVAESMLMALCQSPYFINDLSTNCLLDHSVQFLPINSNIDVPSIFADYYFLEALVRYKAIHKLNDK
ncbi:MAG: glycoside hydrolase family 88 protein [Ignavibacteriales bacterium]|nr:glycoside hydrolase family 88 protein [Ignavibacteriales bacterium]